MRGHNAAELSALCMRLIYGLDTRTETSAAVLLSAQALVAIITACAQEVCESIQILRR